MASLSRALIDGFRRMLSAPVVLCGVFVMTFLLAVPLALTMRGMLEEHLGRSLEANTQADGVNYDWWQEFAGQASGQTSGLATTFTPSVIGFAPVLDNISAIFDGQGEVVPVTAALATYLLGWVFLFGGIVDRYARQRSTRAHAFFSASGVYFFRFLRLAIVAGAAYWLLFTYVHDWLFADVYAGINRNLGVERTAMAWRFGLYAVFALLLAAANLVFDYAKVRAVVEDRRSMLGALVASVAFIRRHPGRVVGLYLANALLFLVLVAVWALVAPGAGGTGASMWLAFIGGQLYLLARLVLKLQFIASQTALFQHSLAHASYVAAPAVAWPDAPIVEGMGAP